MKIITNRDNVFEKLSLINRNFSRSKSIKDLNAALVESFGSYISDPFQIIYWVYKPDEKEFIPSLFGGMSKKEIEDIENEKAPAILFNVLNEGRLLFIEHCQSTPHFKAIKNSVFEKSGSLLIIPPLAGESINSIITLFFTDQVKLSQDIVDILTLVANLATSKYDSLSIENRHFNKLEDYINNEAFNKSVVEYGSDIIIILDPNGTILYHNPSSKETLGYEPGFLVGRSFFDFIHHKNLTRFKNGFKKSIKMERVQKIDYQFLCADGKYKYLESNSINLMDKEGVEGLILDCRDITEEMKTNNALKRQQQFIQQVIDTDPNLIYVKDEHGKFHLINEAVAALHGSTKENVIKMLNAQSKAKPEELYNESKEDAEAILRGEEIIVEESFTMPNDDIKWFQTTKKALPSDDDSRQMLFISVDITQRKKDAEEILSVQRAKEQFLANMSHEIRTPINGIAGLINLLAETSPSLDQKKYLNGIQSSAENLKVIINDILDFSKIESGKLNFEKIGFMPESQISSVIETFKYRTDEKGLQLTYHIDEKANTLMLGDPVRLNQILMNLIGNAVKFTYAGYIKIRASVEETNKQNLVMRFEVEDTGIGIPADKADSIFDSFRQADDSVTRRFGGTGLGLAICKQLVELQGGQINVESEEGTGTTFIFTIPYDRAKEEDLKKLDPNNDSKLKINELGSFENLTILLVEDNDINQMYCTNILKKWNCKVDIAANGYIALDKINKKDYDLVLMDIQMPVMDGFETTRNIRNNFKSPKNALPIIALTANAIKGDNVKCLEVGMDDYLPKPFVPEELFNKIIKLTKIKPRVENDVNSNKRSDGIQNRKSFNQAKPIVDLSYLKDISDNDEEFIKDMILSFLENSPIMLAQIKDATQRKSWEDVGKIAHKIKPSIVFMGINSMKETIENLESFGLKNKNTEMISNLVDVLDATIQQAYKELKQDKILA